MAGIGRIVTGGVTAMNQSHTGRALMVMMREQRSQQQRESRQRQQQMGKAFCHIFCLRR